MTQQYKVTVERFLAAAKLPEPRPFQKGRPAYDPEKWNKPDLVRMGNCYAYIYDALGWVGPGQFAIENPANTLSQMFNGAVSDGLIPAPIALDDPPDIEGYYQVALVDGGNWHWYRKDDNGMWSHKPGAQEVTNLDYAGQPIQNPKMANRGMYDGDVRFFYAPC